MFGNTSPTVQAAPKVANIDADQIASNQQAVPVPYVLGRTRRALHYVAPVYNEKTTKITAQTGKDEEGTVGYVYYGDIAGIFCVVGRRRRLSKLYKLIIDSQVAWKNDAGLAIGNPYSPVTIDGYGAARLYAGRMDQPKDDLILTPILTTIPLGVDPRNPGTFPNGDYTAQHP